MIIVLSNDTSISPTGMGFRRGRRTLYSTCNIWIIVMVQKHRYIDFSFNLRHYCNGLLSSIPSTQLDRVQRLHIWAARFVFHVSIGDHPSQPLLNSLHWLPLKQRIIFKLLLFVYKILNNQAPKYLATCLNLYTPTRSLRSSSDPLRLTYSVTRTLAGDRTFTVSASKYWNDLPLTVRQSSSVSAFRKALKTHLFSSL